MEKIFKKFENYTIKKIDESNMYEVLKMYEKNISYCKSVFEEPTIDSIQEAMTMLPPNITIDKKYFVAFYNSYNEVVAILDIIDGYPEDGTAFIGLFMVDINLQGKGIGKTIISKLLELLSESGFKKCQLGVVENSKEPYAFWKNVGFKDMGKVLDREKYNIVPMEYEL